ncbi:Glycosyltransferase Family 24 protein [Tuber magnatum]|uniref:Glycosyltransferase Family 24 protein n=1 Tax=Tuber magnatum TaxID=42249 RepID=A0A317T1S4_9PEZI|nr:Glycosyltransferase Family 24 protein [Tuber magnatum]
MRLPNFGGRLSVGLLLLSPCVRLVSCGPAVNVALKASWNGAPFLLELLETAAEEVGPSYFPLLDRIAAGDFADIGSDRALYHAFLRVAQGEGFLVDQEELASFNFALSIHAAAPRIEAHYHYYGNSLEPMMGRLYEATCEVWLQWSHKQVCSTGGDFKDMLNDRRKLQFDRVLGTHEDKPAAILYADIEAPTFKQFHEVLRDYAKQGILTYRVRYKPRTNKKGRPVILSGYGVELALKKTDYIVMDDRDVSGGGDVNKGEYTQTPIGELDDQEIQDIKPLHPKDMSFLGMRAASFVMDSEDPLTTLLKLLQDFPKHASSVAAIDVKPDVMDALQGNWDSFLGSGQNALWVNGVQLESSDINAFALLEHLRRERRFVNSFRTLGVNSSEAVQLLSHQILANSRQDEAPQRFDYRDSIEGGKSIIWLNDLEEDLRYREWSAAVGMLLRRVYPGQLHPLRRNIHHLVVPVNLASRDDLALITEQLRLFVDRKIALRFGIVPLTGTPEAVAQAKVFYYLNGSYGLPVALRYLELALGSGQFSKPNAKVLDQVIKEAELIEGRTALSLEEVLSSETVGEHIRASKSWAGRLGANSLIPPVFINGLSLPRDEQWMQTMSARLQADVQLTQRAVYEEIANDETDFATLLLGNAATRRNSYIFPEGEESIRSINVEKLLQEYAHIFEKLPTIISDKPDKLVESTIWVIGDFDEEDGYELLRGASELQKLAPGVNLVFINNPQLVSENPALSTLLHQLHQVGFFKGPEQLRQLLEEMPDVKSSSWRFPDHIESGNFWRESQVMLEVAGFKPGQRGVIINGRVVGPVPIDEEFGAEDFVQLLEYEHSRRILPVLKAANEIGVLEKLKGSQSSARLTNLVALSNVPEVPTSMFQGPSLARTDAFDRLWKKEHVAIESGDRGEAIFQVVASIDPASELAQKWVPILKVLSEMKGVYMEIYLNPQRVVAELPVKRFYRHVLNSAPIFDEHGDLTDPQARFENVPELPLLSLSMDVPPSWLVTPKESPYDLDNLRIQSLKDRLKGTDIEALYELRSILIEGHSTDIINGGPPKGAQLVLGTEKEPHFADTIIMANLGYFQFKANPGYYKMELKEGRSKEIFRIDSTGTKGFQQGKHGVTVEDSEIALLSFQGATLFPRLSRNPGMEVEDVLKQSTGVPKNVGDFATKFLRMAENVLVNIGFLAPVADSKPQADINIFSVASGHLYERFLYIMMLSVMKHTDKSVKFWFIENFLSPSFKDFIPVMAREYGFGYELVTYKWPHWLRGQKEKQREIWGYKILFLDVLFPLDLDKVIFVDADQIVRTDMRELVDLDLQGAPYGFTPMCDSREEIEGFRFWKQGYWKNFLKGLPYHISALYVVDLKRFRQIAAGDRLRQQYHQLSADPNSLSNLDQDLPNHMQSVLPIHSLPQEWLWCETWCSDESLKTAKTIDLCNNPMTKEPKLDRARRQVPEWTAYDEEIAALARRSLKKERGEESEAPRRVEKEEETVEAPGGREGEQPVIREEL